MDYNISQNIAHAAPGSKVVGVDADRSNPASSDSELHNGLQAVLDTITTGLKPGANASKTLSTAAARLNELLNARRDGGPAANVTQNIGTVDEGATVIGVRRSTGRPYATALYEGALAATVGMFIGLQRGDDVSNLLRETAARLQELLDGNAG